MTRKLWILIVLAVVLGGLSYYLNQDWFASEDIHIQHRSRPGRVTESRRSRSQPPATTTDPVYFSFGRKLKLTSLKVIPVSDIATNKYPHPIWHLVSDSNSLPVSEWVYGSYIRGMRPSVKGATPEPLQPGVEYRLLIEAGKTRAEHDFTPVARRP